MPTKKWDFIWSFEILKWDICMIIVDNKFLGVEVQI